jgi:hypothetical protein
MTFPGDVAGGLYAELIDVQLQQERDRKNSLEQRGIAVVTAAGTLVTLVFGFATFVHGTNAIALSPPSIGLFIAALFFFVTAATAGILSNRPTTYLEVDETELSRLTDEALWSWTNRVVAGQRVAQVKVEVITSARMQNASKATLIRLAVASLALATLLLAATAATVVLLAR